MDNLLNMRDFKDIRVLHLQLGPECNMYCKHCHQTPEKGVKGFLFKEISQDVFNFIDHFIAFSQQEHFIKESSPTRIPFTLEFYGGETLLHWSLIQRIVRDFTDKYDLLSNYAFRFSIITNGLLLNEEIVDFVNTYDVRFSFSFDAPHPWAVRGYVPESVCTLVNKIKHLKIICSGCAFNCDPFLALHCLMVKFPEANYVIRTEVLRTFPEMAETIDDYDVEQLRNSIKKLFIAAKLGDKFATRYVKNKLLHVVLHPEDNYFHNTDGVPVCVAGYKHLTITLDGKIPFCYNSFHVIGSIYDDTLDSILQKATAIWKDVYDPACADCEVRAFCYWGCIISLRDEKNHMPSCEKYRKPFFNIVKEEMIRLTQPLSDGEKEWYREQLIIMDKQVVKFLEECKCKPD